jgi:NAD(P)-dependent dehydrogenase (short-subunit alcohol dehydrogenase family)
LNRRVAIVTGGGSGIGAATARLLAERGLTVAVIGRDEEKLDSVVAEIAAAGGAAFAVRADLAEATEPERIVDEVVGRTGRLDVLVNNAAAFSLGLFGELTVEEIDTHLAVNIRAVILLAQAALPALRESDAPAVVNVSSAAAVMYRPGQAVYALSKAALEHLTKQLAAELAPHRIRVNAVRPGPTDTPIHQAFPDPKARLDWLGGQTPLGRVGRPEEIAWWIGALIDPHAEWVTGAVIAVDGGRVLGGPEGS